MKFLYKKFQAKKKEIVEVRIDRPTKVRFMTAEDLILHKIVSERPRDHEDIVGIMRRQSGALDLSYLRPRILELARALSRPDMIEEFEALLRPMS